jgi:hypothetical protein
MLSVNDVGAMKIAAITGRGTRRDFFDLFFFLQRHPLAELLQWYEAKYADANLFLALKSLLYFTDAELDAPVNQLLGPPWPEIVELLRQQVIQFRSAQCAAFFLHLPLCPHDAGAS